MTTYTADTLRAMRLPVLQALFAEVTGEESRSPNKTFLARRILAALADAETEAQPYEDTEASPVEEEASDEEEDLDDELDEEPEAAPLRPLRKCTVEELRERYVHVVGRPTKSHHRSYLIWKIRQAQRGQVPVGPGRRASASKAKHQVLPVRLSVDVVKELDDARERLGLANRMELFRRALNCYFVSEDEHEVAELFLSGD